MRIAATVFVGFLLISSQAHGDEWRANSYRSLAFMVGIRNPTLAGIDIECRRTNYGRAEVVIDLRIPASAGVNLTPTLALVFSSRQQATDLTVQRLGGLGDTMMYRWTAWNVAEYETARSLGASLELSHRLEVKDVAGGSIIAFSFSAGASRASETIRRCGKEAMHAREQASRQSDPKILQAFEADANGRCRGGSGDERATWNACDERTEYSERLGVLGWCYGKFGQIGAEMTWHRCVANSQR